MLREGVFLSYSRAGGGEAKAAKLRARLAQEAPDILIKQDRLTLEGGRGWWPQITAAIDSVQFLILLLTPAAIASGNVQKEWRYARQQGVCVYPVKTETATCLDLSTFPRQMREAHHYDLEKEWPKFLQHLRSPCQAARVPFMAPDLPPHFVQRPAEFNALKSLLLNKDRTQPVAITTALSGAGGFGKTTLAAALCHDEDIIQNFDDGILWITLGQTPDVLGNLVTAYAALAGQRPGFANLGDAANELAKQLDQRTCLLVIDDVWDADHLRPFLHGGKSSARLFTTRDNTIASQAKPVNVDEMSESVELLTTSVPGLNAIEAKQLAEHLGEWPIALDLAAAMIRERIRQGDSVQNAAKRILKRKPTTLQDPTKERRHRTITAVLEASLELLDNESRRRLSELSIFPEDVAIPLAAASSIWQLDADDSEDLAQSLARLSFLKLDLSKGTLRLHDVMRAWLAESLTKAIELHSRLVDSWPDWRNLPHNYAWRWLPWHLKRAYRTTELDQLLWDPRWMFGKLRATDINALAADYEGNDLLLGALHLSAHILANDPTQLASQLVGRLLSDCDSPLILGFVGEASSEAPRPWLRPMHPALHPPGTGLIRTLQGHAGYVHAVAVTSDGRRAVSASRDGTLKVWDLETGRVLQTLEGHSRSVDAVAVTPDGQRAVSSSKDHTLLWDLETGRVLRTLEGRSHWVIGVAVTPDGRRAIAASLANTLKLWDLETGHALLTLAGHSGGVSGLALTPDGMRALAASRDNTLRVWDLGTGTVIRTLKGHSNFVTAVAVTPDGRQAVSACYDGTLKLWNLETGRAILTLKGHSAGVNGVAVMLDGKRAISGSSDETLKVWELETGCCLRTIEAHSGRVAAVAVTPDNRRAVFASGDNTIRIWDLGTARNLRAVASHAAAVSAVAVGPDGRRAVSASSDNTLKVWDLHTGRALLTLEGHSDRVHGVAVTPSGRHAVSASDDNSLKVWDLETGRELRTLEGHDDWVNSVAVTNDGMRAISTSRDKTLKVWELRTGKVIHTLKGHSDEVFGVAITPDGQRAISASDDMTLKVWDLATCRFHQTLEGHSDGVYGVAVTADARRVISASLDKTLKVWDLFTDRPPETLEGHSDWVYGVAITSDGKRAVSTSDDKAIKVWDIATGRCLTTFHCDAPALCCACGPNNLIVAGDQFGRVHFLRLEE